jgi:hypothetical protein
MINNKASSYLDLSKFNKFSEEPELSEYEDDNLNLSSSISPSKNSANVNLNSSSLGSTQIQIFNSYTPESSQIIFPIFVYMDALHVFFFDKYFNW